MATTSDSNVETMRALLYGQRGQASKAPVPGATVTKKKDGEIEVTQEVLDKLNTLLLDKTAADLKPVLLEVIDKGMASKGDELSRSAQGKVDNFLSNLKVNSEGTLSSLEAAVQARVDELMVLAEQVRPIEIRTESSTTPLKGVTHNQFENLLKIVGVGLPVLMVGPAGTGKTHGAELVAKALNIPFHAISVGSQTSKSDIFGYMDANGHYHATAFRDAFENGGVFLLDEADAGNANVLVGLNAALSNGYVRFPDKTVHVHEDFRMIATANTFGNGASRQYVGRNQLDAATLDRFTVLVWNIDDNIEKALAQGVFGNRWYRVVKEIRKAAIEQMELRVVVSPRATLRGSKLLDAGMDFLDVLEVALIANITEDAKAELRNLAIAVWDKTEPKARKPKAAAESKVEYDFDLDALAGEFNG